MSSLRLESPFYVSFAAKVIKTWRDRRFGLDDEDINKDTDFLTISLEISTWPEGDTLLARIRNPTGEPESMVEGKMYDIVGRVYFKKEWHRQYLYITSQRESPEELDAQAQEERRPWFEVVCNITGVFGNSKIGLVWGVFDEYENAQNRQYISTTCPLAKEAVAKEVHKLWKVCGRMAGTTDLCIMEMQSIDSPK